MSKTLKLNMIGDEQLTAPCRDVDTSDMYEMKYLKQTVKKMIETCKHKGGVGLANPQVQTPENLNVFVGAIQLVNPMQYFKLVPVINPVILSQSDKKVTDLEGCLSIASGKQYSVTRAYEIEVEYYSIEAGRRVVRTLKGLGARIFMHETEHLVGKIVCDPSEQHIKAVTDMLERRSNR